MRILLSWLWSTWSSRAADTGAARIGTYLASYRHSVLSKSKKFPQAALWGVYLLQSGETAKSEIPIY